MIKLAVLALLPVAAATLYVQPELPTTVAATSHSESELQDREFLTVLDLQAKAADKAARADREFLANLQTQEMPVRKAIAIPRAEPVAPIAPIAPAIRSTESVAAIPEAPEVRRAIPIPTSQPQDLRRSLNQTFLSMAEPEQEEREVRRATPVNVNRERASITILGDQVIVRPKLSSAAVAVTGLR